MRDNILNQHGVKSEACVDCCISGQYIDTLIYALKINTCVEIVIYTVKNDVPS